MDIASIILVVAIIVAFWGTVKAFTHNASKVIDISMSSLAVASNVLPIKAQLLVDEAQHDADMKRDDLATRKAQFAQKVEASKVDL